MKELRLADNLPARQYLFREVEFYNRSFGLLKKSNHRERIVKQLWIPPPLNRLNRIMLSSVIEL